MLQFVLDAIHVFINIYLVRLFFTKVFLVHRTPVMKVGLFGQILDNFAASASHNKYAMFATTCSVRLKTVPQVGQVGHFLARSNKVEPSASASHNKYAMFVLSRPLLRTNKYINI